MGQAAPGKLAHAPKAGLFPLLPHRLEKLSMADQIARQLHEGFLLLPEHRLLPRENPSTGLYDSAFFRQVRRLPPL